LNKGDTRSGHTQVRVAVERCKGCGFCIEFCPKHIIHRSSETNSKGYHLVYVSDIDKCTGCNICSMVCPDIAISLVSIEEKSGKAE